MDTGLLLIRLLLAFVLVAHSTQKTLGWFQGAGLSGQAAIFERLGLAPGRALVVTASVLELLAAASLALGLLSPLGSLTAATVMLVGGITMHHGSDNFWNIRGGGEYPYVLAILAVGIGFTGPGAWTIDELLSDALPPYGYLLEQRLIIGVTTIIVSAVAALPFVALIKRHS